MNKLALLAIAIAAAALAASGLRAQTLVHPVGAADGGGGVSGGTGYILLGSAGQTAAGLLTDADTGIGIEGGIIPPLRTGSGATLTTNVVVQTSWNMISVPVLPPDPTKTVLLPTAISSAFVYHPPPTGYIAEDTLLPGAGFWVKFPGVDAIPFAGTAVTVDTIAVNAGWNLIGAISYPALAAEATPVGGLTILSSFFAFTGGFGYTSEDTLEPGRAYWVKVSQPGALVLASGSVAIAPSAPPPESVREPGLPPAGISFRDAAGRTRTLQLSGPGAVELPPPPPGGEFDVRFAAPSTEAVPGEHPVVMTGAVWPVEITAGEAATGVSLSVRTSGGERRHDLSAGGRVSVEAPSLLSIRTGNGPAGAAVPSTYRLYQNHPNPFNPVTTVTVDLPAKGRIVMSILNSLGQTVMEVLDGEMEAGRHLVRIDASRLASGVYFARMTAAGFTDMKKMVLLK